MNTTAHPFDQAIRLLAQDEGTYTGQITAAYANMVGPFGGVIAATLLNAVLLHPQHKGEPVALTINFAGPITDAEFQVSAQPVRTNRSTQHWNIALTQDGETAVTATAMLAVRRESWSAQELGFPDVPAAHALTPTLIPVPIAWVKNYQMRFIDGMLTMDGTGGSESSLSRLWVRDEPPRTLDFLSLTALADVFFPRVFVRRQMPCPAGTVSMTVYYHASGEELATFGQQPVLACARANQLRKGFADQTAQLWSHDGQLLVTSQQLVYYKA
jgi:acyl-CoA thioesterase